jgi:hypothetical protein
MTMRRFADRMLARLVPEQQASACKEYRRCIDDVAPVICYVGCGCPTFCVSADGHC